MGLPPSPLVSTLERSRGRPGPELLTAEQRSVSGFCKLSQPLAQTSPTLDISFSPCSSSGPFTSQTAPALPWKPSSLAL